MPEVTIYTKPWCGYCWRAKRMLDAKGVVYQEIDVTEDPRLEAEMINRSGRTTAPQIFLDDDYLGDSDGLMRLEREGKLDELLQLNPATGEGDG